MPTLTNRDKLEILSRNSQFLADLEELNKPQSLHDTLSPEVQERREHLRTRIVRVWPNSNISPEGVKTLLQQVRQGSRRDQSLTRAVRPIPHERILGDAATPGTIRYLRAGCYLTIEIDLTAATKEALLEEISEFLEAFRPEHMKGIRKRKKHETTAEFDPWKVYDQRKSGKTLYEIAKTAYARNNGTKAGFTGNSREYKAAKRALKAAESMMNSLQYPPR